MASFSKPRGVFSTLLAIFVLLQVAVASHGAHHAHHMHRSPEFMEAQFDESKRALEERANNIAITGVTGTVGERKEIRDLKKNADQWNLYLLGMERFKAKPHSDRLSYYQIAGIHGRPYQTWNNFPTPLVNNAGFCVHGGTLFGTWHRPFLSIYEQAWFQSVQEVISTFPANQQQRWRNAASGLRMPFWDWAVAPPNGESNVPTLIRDKRVSVTKPQGKVTIDNPLYSFTFGNSLPPEIGGGPWGNWPITLRRPVGNPTRSNNDQVHAEMTKARVSLRDRVYYLFLSKASWGFASTSAIGARTQVSSRDSFESIHDAVHGTVGGPSGGTMYYLDYSAFDPIFWLHHTNIDRLLAMYQQNTPNTWVANGVINHPMAQWNQGESKNEQSPLKPFTKNTRGDYYNSVEVKNTRTLGYFYADASSPQAMRNAVNGKYSGGRNGLRKRTSSSSLPTGQYDGRAIQAGDYHTVLSIVADKFALEGSYTVHCTLGPAAGNSTSNTTAPYTNSTAPYSNSTDEEYAPNYVGGYTVFGGHGNAAPSSNHSVPLLTEGCLPLTTALMGAEAAGTIKSLHPDDIEAYLTQNLHYTVVGLGGAEIPADEIPNFHVYVQSAPLTPASGDEFPSVGEYTKMPSVTANMPGGKPWTYVPGPYDFVSETEEVPSYTSPYGPGASSTSPNYPQGTMVWGRPQDEQGYCVSEQTVVYVDEEGGYLYEEKS
ncbi:tyrosinase [Polyplosphaeria fusca]|uniref:tyrosinase n=1 Tax=Polyplosphaeria fusca TaxID=682080 RepID=A0A9P4QX66_9PLEO|nr:tyrosinase [Polyplosphaeria fusca]